MPDRNVTKKLAYASLYNKLAYASLYKFEEH